MNEVTEIYDKLLLFESRNKSGQSYPVHKKLKFTNKNHTLLNWLSSKINFSNDDFVLDAGCGTGFTLFYLHKNYRIKGLGISLSNSEINYASKTAKRNNIDSDISFKVISYDHIGGKFSKILAIESLKHSKDPWHSLNHLLQKLNPGGILVICDDFIIKDSLLFQKQKKYWSASGFKSLNYYLDTISQIGDFDIEIYDLTSNVRIRNITILNILNLLLNLILKFSLHNRGRNLKTYAGALMLEKLYALKSVRYQAIIINKNH